MLGAPDFLRNGCSMFLNRLIENKYVREDDSGKLYLIELPKTPKDAAKFLEPNCERTLKIVFNLKK